MRKFMLLAACMYAASSFAQDPCSKVEKTEKELEGQVTYMSAYKGGSVYSISTIRIIAEKSDNTAVAFNLKDGSSDYRAKGLFVKFSNGEILKDPERKVDCSYVSGGTYSFTGYMYLSEENRELLSKEKIVKFSMNGNEIEVSPKIAEEFQKYFNCILEKTK